MPGSLGCFLIPFANFSIFEDGIQKPIDLNNSVASYNNAPFQLVWFWIIVESLSAAARTDLQNAATAFCVANLTNPFRWSGGDQIRAHHRDKFRFLQLTEMRECSSCCAVSRDTGGTILYDSLITAIDDTALRTNSRRAIIVFSDAAMMKASASNHWPPLFWQWPT